MKKSVVLMTLIVFAFGALALGALAAEPQGTEEAPIAQVRIVNVSALSGMTYNDNGLVTLANLDVSKNTKIFPIVADFSIIESGKKYKAGADIPCQVTCPINISSTIKEDEKLAFTSVQDLTVSIEATPKEFNIAVVKKNSAVKRFNEAAEIDYSKKTLKTAKPIPLAEGDTLLVFVRDVPKSYFDYQGLQGEQGFVPF